MIRTELYYSPKWGNRDIQKLVSRLTGQEASIKPAEGMTDNEMSILTFGNERINIHHAVDMPFGTCRLLSMYGEDKRLLHDIGEVIGGLYNPTDSQHNMELLHGKLWEEDGLQYFLMYAAITNPDFNGDNLDALKTTIDKWNKEHMESD